MALRVLPDAEYLRQCFDLDETTGHLTYRHRPRSHFKLDRGWRQSNELYAGKRADKKGPHGYRQIRINKVSYRAHRVVWKMVHGYDPLSIDHINRDRSDNRPCNLRDCTQQQNNMNTSVYRNNRCGVKGVHRCNGKWRAMIRIDGKSHHIGMFETLDDATKAYASEAKRLFGEFADA